MAKGYFRKLTALLFLLIPCAFCLPAMGCKCAPPPNVPTELNKVTHPEYRIAPPDVLLIDATNLIPRPPYRIAAFDGLLIRVTVPRPLDGYKSDELLKGEPINGLYRVEVNGDVQLGFSYGPVAIGGKTIPEAKAAIIAKLKERFKLETLNFDVLVALVESRALQQVRGEHLVRQDGKVTLGIYGSVYVTGMTLEEAKLAIETHLSRFLFEPQVSIDITGYNSKVYYIIVDLGEAGKQVTRLPITGNETVLDALGLIKGLPPTTDFRRIQVARRSPIGQDYCQVLPVDWKAIVCGGSTATNYQLLPGDRLYVGVDRWVYTDQIVAKVLAPIERILGVVLLGDSVVQAIAQPLGVAGTAAAP